MQEPPNDNLVIACELASRIAELIQPSEQSLNHLRAADYFENLATLSPDKILIQFPELMGSINDPNEARSKILEIAALLR